jgi:hypothetical protein
MADVNINGVTLQLDLLDADVVEKFEGLMDKYRADINSPDEGLSNADQMRRQIRLTDQLFDDVFGEGSAARIFEGVKPGNLMARLNAVADLSTIHASSEKEIRKIQERVQNGQYSQRLNRQQRRHRNKH